MENKWNNIKFGDCNEDLVDATIHYNSVVPIPNPTPLPMTTATVMKSETDKEYILEVTPETVYEDCYVCAGIYNENDVFVGIQIVPLESTGSTTLSVNKEGSAKCAKVFIWADTMQPIIEAAEIALEAE